VSELIAALGLVLAIEGTLYALAPQTMRDLMAKMQETPNDTLRIAGVSAVAIGVVVVWLARG